MNDLNLRPVDALPTPHDGFADCGVLVGCEANGVRLNTKFSGSRYFNCLACRNFLSHEPGRGWRLTVNSREEILRRRDEVKEQHEPKIGAGWKALKKMRKAA